MEFLIASAAIGLLLPASTEKANAAVHCQYDHYRADCVASPGAALRPRRVGSYA